jgi:hypothetical protein
MVLQNVFEETLSKQLNDHDLQWLLQTQLLYHFDCTSAAPIGQEETLCHLLYGVCLLEALLIPSVNLKVILEIAFSQRNRSSILVNQCSFMVSNMALPINKYDSLLLCPISP